MRLSNKELLDKCKDEVARDNHFNDWQDLYDRAIPYDIDLKFWPIVCERFATEKAKELFTRSEVESCIKDSLEAAAENACVRGYCKGCEAVGMLHCAHADSCGHSQIIVDKSTITHPSNIKIK